MPLKEANQEEKLFQIFLRCKKERKIIKILKVDVNIKGKTKIPHVCQEGRCRVQVNYSPYIVVERS